MARVPIRSGKRDRAKEVFNKQTSVRGLNNEGSDELKAAISQILRMQRNNDPEDSGSLAQLKQLLQANENGYRRRHRASR